MIVHLLEPLGFIVLEASNGQEGLDQAVAQQPDVVLVDLVMPIMDGFEMTRRLRKIAGLSDVLVIAISASVLDFDQRMSQEACCNAFLPKPVHEAALLEKLQTGLGLEWIYEPELEGNVTQQIPKEQTPNPQVPAPIAAVPDLQQLNTLLDLALMGDLKGIVEQTYRLEQGEPQQSAFTAQLRQLAKSFKGKQVIEFIKHYQAQA